MKNLILTAIAISSLAACADPGPTTTRYNENEYVTGSNLPRRGSMPPEARTVADPESWLLSVGWRRAKGGLVAIDEVPAAARR